MKRRAIKARLNCITLLAVLGKAFAAFRSLMVAFVVFVGYVSDSVTHRFPIHSPIIDVLLNHFNIRDALRLHLTHPTSVTRLKLCKFVVGTLVLPRSIESGLQLVRQANSIVPNWLCQSTAKLLRLIVLRRRYRQVLSGFLVGLLIFVGIPGILSSRAIAFLVPSVQFIGTSTREIIANPNDRPNNEESFKDNESGLQQLLQHGREHFKAGQFSAAISALKQAAEQLQDRGESQQLADLLMNLGNAELAIGQAENALSTWQDATRIYETLHRNNDASRSRIYQTWALQMLGLHIRACETLVEAIGQERLFCQTIDETQFKRIVQALEQQSEQNRFIGLHRFGQILRSMGKLDEAQVAAARALTVAVSMRDRSIAEISQGNILRALGNLERDRKNSTARYNDIPWHIKTRPIPSKAQTPYKEAYQAYQRAIDYEQAIDHKQAIDNTAQSNTKIKAQLNQLSLLLETLPPVEQKDGAKNQPENLKTANRLWQEIHLNQLPTSHDKVYSRINLAKSLTVLKQYSIHYPANNTPGWNTITALLESALQEARALQDRRTLSYTLGNLGSLYEYFAWSATQHHQATAAQKWRQLAIAKTQDALLAIQPLVTANAQTPDRQTAAPHITYQWQWQLGRLLSNQGNREKAIAAFEDAIETLDSVRGDLLAIKADVQFSFRDNVEPLYRKLVDLLLRTQTDANLEKALDYIDSLQLAELENFLSCNLSQVFQLNRDSDQIDPHAAFIYPIVLENSLDVIFKLPGQDPKLYTHAIQQTEVEKVLRQLRQALPGFAPDKILKNAQQVYDWLIAPLEGALNDNQIETLVFVLDGDLRNIPMAALFDRKTNQYLVEKNYSLVLLPSSKLFDLQAMPKRNGILGAGISEPVNIGNQRFKALNAEKELKQLQQMPASEILLNQQFTREKLERKLNSAAFSTIHLATHGNFSSDPKQTYVLAYNQFLRADDLKNLLHGRKNLAGNSTDLLVLSACKTAEGDHRAALGLAGLAVRTGTGSTLATLWQVSDDSTIALMERFYQELTRAEVTKAEALHRAQKALLSQADRRFQNPYYWAPYILVGNWH